MKIKDIENGTIYYHGSYEELPVGTVLKPTVGYEDRWGNTDFYKVLESYRPKNMLSHKESVFMVGDADDIDAAGGGTEWVFHVKVLGPVQRHDMNWSTDVSMIMVDSQTKYPLSRGNNFWFSSGPKCTNMYLENFNVAVSSFIDDGLVEFEEVEGGFKIIDTRIPTYWLKE